MNPIEHMMASGEFRDQEQAVDVLKASLQALRDRLPKIKAYHLGVQLPESLRHAYFEGWHNSQRQTESVNKSEFLAEVKDHLQGSDEFSLTDVVPVALHTVLKLISDNDADEVQEALPHSLKDIFDAGQAMH